MRRNLLILRHGQAAGGAPDIARPLTERGRVDAGKVGAWLRQQGLLPELVVASAARRTTETAQLCCAAAGVDAARIRYERGLYQADCADWMAELATIPDGVTTVLLIGHNPTLSWLVGQLGGEPGMLSTANLVHLVTDGDWNSPMRQQAVIRPQAL